MLFSVGYQVREGSDFVETVVRNREKISEIYFSFDDFPNGRNSADNNEQLTKWEIHNIRSEQFETLNKNGLKFNLLLNGNCYGRDSQARSFFCKIGDTVDYLAGLYNLSCVTTTSPLIAKFLKQNFPEIEVRASVNMSIGETEGLDYVEELFDSFYLKREYNRNLSKLKKARKWCDDNGKKLYGLANSGCLNFCSAHTFHDNLVSHENEISQMDNAYQFAGQCHEYLKNPEKRKDWLRITNFIRPEDVHLYEGLFDGMKLATRVNKAPSRIVDAYCKASFSGSVMDLLEPNHSGLFYPAVIDNKSISENFGKTVMNCLKNCNECGLCAKTQNEGIFILE